MIIDLFAGPGGWDEGLKANGRTDVLGIEVDRDACTTAEAAGHARLKGDVYGLNPVKVAAGRTVEGVIGSPPCGGLSGAGLGVGKRDLVAVVDLLAAIAHQDSDPRTDYLMDWEDLRSPLLCEPLRWALATGADWLVLEQVPAALGVWREYERHLTGRGWSCDVAVVDAADYGVPQNRKRAIFVGHRTAEVHLPKPSHGSAGGVRQWVSMAEALGWPAGMVGFPRRADGGARVEIDGVAYRARDLFDVGSPAQTVTEKARSWQRRAFVATNIRANSAVRGEHEPAPTLAFGHERPQWVDADAASGVRGVPVTPSEAGQLQSFRADYPWHGLPSSQFQQIGNAVPPLLAQAITGVVLTANE